METWGPLTWLYYRGWPANTGPNTCYGETLGPGCIIEGGLLTQVQTHAMEALGPGCIIEGGLLTETNLPCC